jgi:hypothetical protein
MDVPACDFHRMHGIDLRIKHCTTSPSRRLPLEGAWTERSESFQGAAIGRGMDRKVRIWAHQPRNESGMVSAKPLSTTDVHGSMSCGVSSTSVSLSTVIASPYFRFKSVSIGRSAASPDNFASPDVLEAVAPDVDPDAADDTAADAATMAARSGQATVSAVCLHTGTR